MTARDINARTMNDFNLVLFCKLLNCSWNRATTKKYKEIMMETVPLEPPDE